MTNNILIKLSEYLNDTDILKNLLPIIDEFRYTYTFETNEELKFAVVLWYVDKNTARKKYGYISLWNTKNITNMSFLFEDTPFNEDISSWDTSNVTNMNGMFANAESFNQPLSFNTEKLQI